MCQIFLFGVFRKPRFVILCSKFHFIQVPGCTLKAPVFHKNSVNFGTFRGVLEKLDKIFKKYS